jgi:hypothetical protein
MFRRIAVAAAAITLSTFALVGHAALTDAGKGSIKIEGVAKPGLGAFSGDSSDISAREDGGKLIFTANLKNNLHMGLRASHTHECFKTEKHPTATLTVDKSKLKMPEDNQEVHGKVTADLKLAGVSKPVEVNYTVSRTGSDYHVKKADFTFDYTKFGVEKICKVGVCVDPNVKISIDKPIKLRDK